MTLLSPYNPRTTVTTTHEQQQQRSSSAFIAHLLVQEYPPKVQPRSSSARDKALYSHLDKVDAEAGCILIALANHDKRKDMNDLIPYSIRVIDYNQTKTTETTDSTSETTTGESISISSTSSSSSSSSCSDSISDGTIRDAENDDPTSTSDEGDSNGTMSIKNLIDVNNESSSSDTPALSGNTTLQPGRLDLSPSSSSRASSSRASSSRASSSTIITTTPFSSASLITQHSDDNDHSKTKTLCKPEPRTDPILLLAAAAKAIDQGELLHQGANQKRKYSNDDSCLESRSHSARRPRYTMESQTALDQSQQSEKSKFSHQYLSMKQNPKIMRNAMHAYISYMIYTDLTSSEKMSRHQSQGITAPATSYSTHPSSPHSHYATSHPTFSAPSPSTFNHHHHPHPHPSQHHAHYDYSSSRTNEPTPSTDSSPINLGPPNSSIAGNSSIMARPLTAFLRDNMYA